MQIGGGGEDVLSSVTSALYSLGTKVGETVTDPVLHENVKSKGKNLFIFIYIYV